MTDLWVGTNAGEWVVFARGKVRKRGGLKACVYYAADLLRINPGLEQGLPPALRS